MTPELLAIEIRSIKKKTPLGASRCCCVNGSATEGAAVAAGVAETRGAAGAVTVGEGVTEAIDSLYVALFLQDAAKRIRKRISRWKVTTRAEAYKARQPMTTKFYTQAT